MIDTYLCFDNEAPLGGLADAKSHSDRHDKGCNCEAERSSAPDNIMDLEGIRQVAAKDNCHRLPCED